ncbi:hypothetical protein FVE85_7072 [Porphyridium purpureum]|uniref:Lon N-terminal domain-containing protein n=1 Tax=Porphyridium purpureum TaxID=35688 RepID=A0A5J4ZA25_PORPP|nr:hypothetical protein FVE85_7072 [Porphyridium purpureum]|eukprot:POR3367..scf295_1
MTCSRRGKRAGEAKTGRGFFTMVLGFTVGGVPGSPWASAERPAVRRHASRVESAFPRVRRASAARSVVRMGYRTPADAYTTVNGSKFLTSDIDLTEPFLLELFSVAGDDFAEVLLPGGAMGSYAVPNENALKSLIHVCKAPQRTIRGLYEESVPMAPLFGFLVVQESKIASEPAPGSETSSDVSEGSDVPPSLGTLALATYLNQKDAESPVLFQYQGICRIQILSLMEGSDEGSPWALVEAVWDNEQTEIEQELLDELIDRLREYFALSKKLGDEFGLTFDALDFSGEIKVFEELLDKLVRAELKSRARLCESLSFFACDQLGLRQGQRVELFKSMNTKRRILTAISELQNGVKEMHQSFDTYQAEKQAEQEAAAAAESDSKASQ